MYKSLKKINKKEPDPIPNINIKKPIVGIFNCDVIYFDIISGTHYI
jgi:hypothetical protein